MIRREFLVRLAFFSPPAGEVETGTPRNAERAKQPLLPLTSAISNHNCPSLLVWYIHRPPPFRPPPRPCPSPPPSSLVPFAALSSSCAITHLLLLPLSGIPFPSLSFACGPRCLSSPPWAASGAAPPPPPSPSSPWWGLNYHNFVLFIPRGKKKRIIFGGNATILSAVVM